ncbi:ABC transporter substrate-binding protein [Pigmentiphaga aceris]|uniref:ABC transporter substrate-binding protein n=1 Tax=Pigmentiphaga aceris TaxID=1940612 RepID=A0A5C0ATZ1_9BURK|nr:ABC transporter substrate-binding protein [Pigmentiphaga aceris]QEI05849.1 ABC transporter substrate-binding protein [Pigmentiphaga aceris]
MKNMKRNMLAASLALMAGSVMAQDFRIGLQEDPDMLDPHRARTYVGRIVFTSLCDKLVDIDQKLQITPQLATSWAWSADNKVLTFKLREGVTFHDGKPFDAAAAKANIERALTLKDSMRRSEMSSIESAEAPDAQTLVLKLKQPDATLLAALTDRAGMMLSPATFTDDTAAVARSPVCSGPYKFVSRVQNDRIVLEKYDQYYDAKNYAFKRIIFRPIPDTTVRLSNLRAGDLDILERLNPSDVTQVKGDKSVQFMPVSGLGYVRFMFNIGNSERAKANPFNDKLVRQAFALAVDRNVINQVVGENTFVPAQTAYPAASPFHDEKKFPVTGRDVAKAKALLKQAGKPTVKAELVYGNNTTTSAIAEMVQAMAAEAGFQLSLRPTEYAAMLKESTSGNFDVQLQGWSGRPDPDGNVHTFLTCKGAQNDGRYCNPEVDKLLDQARVVTDLAARKDLYDRAETIMQDEMPGSYIYYQPWLFVASTKVQGFTPSPDGMIRLKGVSLK